MKKNFCSMHAAEAATLVIKYSNKNLVDHYSVLFNENNKINQSII